MKKVKFSWWLTLISLIVLLGCVGLLIANGITYKNQLEKWGLGFKDLLNIPTNLPTSVSGAAEAANSASDSLNNLISPQNNPIWEQFKKGVTNPFIFQMIATGLVGLLSLGTFAFGLRNWIKNTAKV